MTATHDIHADKILILDFGAQYTQLIARRVREAGVYAEIHPWDISASDIAAYAPKGIILSGGPESVNDGEPPRAADNVFELGVPVLGICYGMQTMAAQLGGEVSSASHREFGHAVVRARESRLLDGFADSHAADNSAELSVWMSHGDKVDALPAGFTVTASSDNAPIAAMEDPDRRFYAVQFHPEVTHTLQGAQILTRFVRDFCGCAGEWTTGNIAEDAILRIREQVGEDRELLGLSVGVDTSIVAAMLHEAIGDQLVCVFVDHGLLRHNEGDQVMATFAEHLGVNVIRVDAAERFFGALAGVTDPEEKRKVIGRLFIEVFDEQAEQLQDIAWLAQGTIYPDVIESG